MKNFATLLTSSVIRSVVSLVPDDWLTDEPSEITAEEKRDVYINFLTSRLAHSPNFVKEAQHAREALI
jgi:hypothetical protein